MRRVNNKESGMLIVEATIVFPVIFFAIFFLIYMGNMFYMRSQVDSAVATAAIKGASYCADPMLEQIYEKGSVPRKNKDVKPYRYFTSMSYVESSVMDDLNAELKNIGSGLFSNMEIQNQTPELKYNFRLFYYTYKVSVDYKMKFPIRFLGSDEPVVLSLSSSHTAPITDTAEFINNVDMAIDYYQASGAAAYVDSVFGKIKDFFKKTGTSMKK